MVRRPITSAKRACSTGVPVGWSATLSSTSRHHSPSGFPLASAKALEAREIGFRDANTDAFRAELRAILHTACLNAPSLSQRVNVRERLLLPSPLVHHKRLRNNTFPYAIAALAYATLQGVTCQHFSRCEAPSVPTGYLKSLHRRATAPPKPVVAPASRGLSQTAPSAIAIPRE